MTKKKWFVLLFLVLPLTLLVLGYFFPHRSPRSTIRGSYQTEPSNDTVTLTFESEDHSFVLYHNSRQADTGTYTRSDDTVYLLKSAQQDTYVVLQADNSFYYYDTTLPEPRLYHLHLLSTVPGYFDQTYYEESAAPE